MFKYLYLVQAIILISALVVLIAYGAWKDWSIIKYEQIASINIAILVFIMTLLEIGLNQRYLLGFAVPIAFIAALLATLVYRKRLVPDDILFEFLKDYFNKRHPRSNIRSN